MLTDDIPVPIPAQPIRFMGKLRVFMRGRHLAYRTEKTYCGWIRGYIRFHKMRRPEELGKAEVDAWLGYLASQRNVSVNTQKTALNAIVFLYHQFLGIELGKLDFDRTSKGRRLPVVFTHEEATAIIDRLHGHHKLLASLMYGSGLRVMEAVRLRVQDVDFGRHCIFVREAKGN